MGFSVDRTSVTPSVNPPSRPVRQAPSDVIVTDSAIWTREDAEFFATHDGKDVQFPPKLVSIQQGQMARARRLAQDRGESFDPAAYILMRSRVDPDLFDGRLAAQALDFYGRRGLTSMGRSDGSTTYYA